MSSTQYIGDAPYQLASYRDSAKSTEGYVPSEESSSEEVDDEPEHDNFLNSGGQESSKETQRTATNESHKQEQQPSRHERDDLSLPSASKLPVHTDSQESTKQQVNSKLKEVPTTTTTTKSSSSEKEIEHNHPKEDAKAKQKKKDDSFSEDGELKDDDDYDTKTTVMKQQQHSKSNDTHTEAKRTSDEYYEDMSASRSPNTNVRQRREKTPPSAYLNKTEGKSSHLSKTTSEQQKDQSQTNQDHTERSLKRSRMSSEEMSSKEITEKSRQTSKKEYDDDSEANERRSKRANHDQHERQERDKEQYRERNRERERERERNADKDRPKDKDLSKNKERDRTREREKEKERNAAPKKEEREHTTARHADEHDEDVRRTARDKERHSHEDGDRAKDKSNRTLSEHSFESEHSEEDSARSHSDRRITDQNALSDEQIIKLLPSHISKQIKQEKGNLADIAYKIGTNAKREGDKIKNELDLSVKKYVTCILWYSVSLFVKLVQQGRIDTILNYTPFFSSLAKYFNDSCFYREGFVTLQLIAVSSLASGFDNPKFRQLFFETLNNIKVEQRHAKEDPQISTGIIRDLETMISLIKKNSVLKFIV